MRLNLSTRKTEPSEYYKGACRDLTFNRLNFKLYNGFAALLFAKDWNDVFLLNL